MKISVVSTLYQSAPYIDEFHERVSSAARALAGDDYEIILVNDGSPDNSLALAIALTERDEKLTVIDLSRNFGHHKAIMTGLDHASGDLVYLIDSDLEEQPEWLEVFHDKLTSGNHDVVFGVQSNRKGGWFERASGAMFYSFFDMFLGVRLPRNLLTVRLMRRRYVRALAAHREREIMISGLWQTTGFDQVEQPVKKMSTSATTYTLDRKISMMLSGITSFSNAPLVMIFKIGSIISLFSFLYVIYIIFNWAVLSNPPNGWTSVAASIWLLGGLTISFMGMIGIYLAKIFTEVKQRPYTVVREIFGQRND